jgi:hypothetical protein
MARAANIRLRPVAFGKGPIARAAGKMLLAMMARKMHASYLRSLATLERIVGEDLAAGRIERWPTKVPPPPTALRTGIAF